MADFRERIKKLSPERLALLALELQAKIENLERQRTEPIAIIGIGCRLPGCEPGAEGFWRLLDEGRDAISQIPSERWDIESYYNPDPDVPGRTSTKWGAFLSEIASFDAPFFGISRREAVSMDPQQRILLEVCWEALEHAGYCPRKPAAGATGVFVGMTTTDYHDLMLERGEDTIDVHTATGSGHSIATGRISYALSLQGPNLAVDTACSASLVAVHLACQSLRSNECRMALAGGVNALLSPELFIALSKARVLSPDGRCKVFDAKADGFVRAEGCGIVALKRLSDARADGDHILALIRGSAVNQDGRSSGLTAPNGAAQEAVIRQALAAAGVAPQDVDYMEAHGTGTALGDPIEAHALAAVLGPGRTPDHPLVLGSAKTNVGHLESASGVAGLIKIVLSLQHGRIPKHLHFQSMNPHIDWKDMPVRIPVESIPWERSGRRRIAGLSSFGLSGTNSHVVVEEAPLPEVRTRAFERPLHLLALSARSDSALTALRDRFSAELAGSQADLGDICYTAGAGRAHFEHRATFVAATREAMRDELLKGPITSGSASAVPQIVFLFPGQGAQYSGMFRELYGSQPVFRDSLDQCAELLRGQLETPLLDVLWSDSSQLLDQTAYTQPALFAVEYALAKLWMSWGIEPAAVMGHSVGEYVAACIAGVFSLADGLKLIAARARLMQGAGGNGGMAAVMASEDEVRKAIRGLEHRVTIAALNGPSNVVIAGYKCELDRVQELLAKDGVRVQPLAVSHGFHSPQMREMEAAFEDVARTVTFHLPSVRIISSVTGREEREAMLEPAYWRRQVMQPVRFQDAMVTLDQAGYRTFLELGPGTTLTGMGRQCTTRAETVWLPSVRKARGEWLQMLDSLAQLYTRGVDIDWAGFDRPYSRRRVPLPTYPFERQHYWFESRGGSKRIPSKNARTENIDDWFYEVAWEPRELGASQHAAAGRWLIVPDAGGVAAALASKLSRDPGGNVVLAANGDALAEHLRKSDFDFVVHAASLDYPNPSAFDVDILTNSQSALDSVLAGARAIAGKQSGPRLWLVTAGAQPVVDGVGVNILQTPVWGLGRTFALEHPESWGGFVDLDPTTAPAESADALFSAIVQSGGEDQLAFRGGRCYAGRLVRRRPTETQASFSADKTYLITGGMGGLGLKIAFRMAENGARNLVTLGRRAPSEDGVRALDELRGRGVRVEFHSVDITNASDLQAVLDRVSANMPPLGGVIHAAGVLDDGVIAQLNPERFRKVLAPKVTGTWNLHALTSHLPLDLFVMFSSIASVTGSPGQASYAAANAFMDGFADYRKTLGLPALSLNWGGWADVGMAARVDAGLRQRGGPFRLMPSSLAIEAFGRALSGSSSQVTIASIDWDQLQESAEGRNPRPLFRSILRPVSRREDKTPGAAKALDAILSSPPDALQARLMSYLQTALAPILGVDPASIGAGRPLIDFGLDSLMALEFRNRISVDLNITVSTASLLQGPSLEELAAEVGAQFAHRGGDPVESKPLRSSADYPLSYAQKAQWFGHKLNPDSSDFNVAFTAAASPCLNWSAFERAVNKLVDRHPSFRTVVVEKEDGQPMQRVLDSTIPNLALVDVAGWPEQAVKEQVLREFNRPFTMDCPMARIHVFRSERQDAILFMLDHLIVDASSLQICFDDLKALYTAEVAGADAGLKPLQAQYRDFVEWESALVEAPESERLWDYWKRKLDGNLPVLSLPECQSRPAGVFKKGHSVPLQLGLDLSAKVLRAAREHRATSYSVLLAAYQILLKAYCGQDDILVATSVSRRDDPRWSNVMGMFINVLALRTDLSDNPTFAGHLARTRESVLGALAHQEFPFPEIVNRLRAPRPKGRNPICQAFMNLLTDRSGELGGLMASDRDAAIPFGESVLRPFLIIPQQEGQSDIVLQMGQVENQFVGNINYNTELIDQDTAEQMAKSYTEILEQAIQEPHVRIDSLVSSINRIEVEREEFFLS